MTFRGAFDPCCGHLRHRINISWGWHLRLFRKFDVGGDAVKVNLSSPICFHTCRENQIRAILQREAVVCGRLAMSLSTEGS